MYLDRKPVRLVVAREPITLRKCQRVIDYLMRQEIRAIGLDERDHYKFCRLLVSKAADDWPDPYVSAFYYHYGRHPIKLIPEWEARETYAKSLGPSLADIMASAEIPDYDPTIPLSFPPSQSRPLEPSRDTRQKRPHGLPRRIVNRTPLIERGKLRYYTETLECGHSHIEFPGGNRGRHRHCKQCMNGGPAEQCSLATPRLRYSSGLGRLSSQW